MLTLSQQHSESNYSSRQVAQKNAIPILLFFVLISIFFSVSQGAVDVPIAKLPEYLWQFFATDKTLTSAVITEIRLPRVILAAFVGAGLACAGAVMQALFRNPLADPGLIGVSSGGALGANTIIVLGSVLFTDFVTGLGIFAIPIGAMLGCLVVCALIYALSVRKGNITIITLLLAGIAINAIVGSIIGIFTLVSDDSQLRELTFWSMGNLGGNNWQLTMPVLFLIAFSIAGMLKLSKPLNLYLLGEKQAGHLGLSVSRLKKKAFFFTALAVGASVSISGIIGFVGFIVPHLIRMVIGPDHRYLLPASVLFGSSFLVLADTLARLVIIPAELPIGLVTSALGGPFFLILLYRKF